MRAWTDETDYAPEADAHLGRFMLAVMGELTVATAVTAAVLAGIALTVGWFA